MSPPPVRHPLAHLFYMRSAQLATNAQKKATRRGGRGCIRNTSLSVVDGDDRDTSPRRFLPNAVALLCRNGHHQAVVRQQTPALLHAMAQPVQR